MAQTFEPPDPALMGRLADSEVVVEKTVAPERDDGLDDLIDG